MILKIVSKRAARLNSVTISTSAVSCSARCATWSCLLKSVATRCTRDEWRRELRLKSRLKLKRCRHSRSSWRRSSRNLKRSTESSWERRPSWRISVIRHTCVAWQLFQLKPLKCLTQLLMTFTRACDSLATMATTCSINLSNSKVAQQCSQ